MENLNQCEEVDTSGWRAYYSIALSHYRARRFDSAMEYFEKVLAVKPDHQPAWAFKGDSFYSLGHVNDALMCFNQAILLDDGDEQVWKWQGDLLYDLEKYEDALTCFEKILSMNDKNKGAWNCKGNTLYKLGNLAEAISCFGRATDIDPSFIDARMNLAVTLYETADYRKALECFDLVMQEESTHREAWSGAAKCHFLLRNLADAIECFDRVAELDRDAELDQVCLWGRKLALKFADELLTTNEECVAAWAGKAEIFRSLGKYQKSTLCFDQIRHINAHSKVAEYRREAQSVLDELCQEEEVEKGNRHKDSSPEDDDPFDEPSFGIDLPERYHDFRQLTKEINNLRNLKKDD